MIDQRAGTLRALKGAPLSIVFALLLFTEPHRSLGTKQLAALTGYSRNSITDGLAALAELGLAQTHSRYSGWTLTHSAAQLLLTNSTQLLENSEAQNLRLPTSEAQNLSIEAQNLRLPPSEAQNLRLPPTVVSSSSSPQQQELTPTTNLLPAEAQKMSLQTLLTRTGIYPRLAAQLAADPWCTTDRANAWIANLTHQTQYSDHTIRSLPALLAANLRRHLEAPVIPTELPTDSYHRFLCPTCGAEPGHCTCH